MAFKKLCMHYVFKEYFTLIYVGDRRGESRNIYTNHSAALLSPLCTFLWSDINPSWDVGGCVEVGYVEINPI